MRSSSMLSSVSSGMMSGVLSGDNNNNGNGMGPRKFDKNPKFGGHNHNTYQVHPKCDMGKIIDLDDIIAYIETNKKFIDAPKNDTIGFLEDDQKDIKIDLLNYNKSGNLENLPNSLSTVFGSVNNFKRLGVIHHVQIPAEIDISLVASLLSIVVDDFIKLKESEQIEFTEIFIRKIHKEAREKYIEFGYEKLGWKLKEFVNNVKTFTLCKNILRYVADYLFINIFIIDIEADSLVYVGEKNYVKYKKNVFILKLGDSWFEPVLVPNTKYFEYSSSTIKKLVNSKFLVERMDCDFTNEKEEFNFIVGLDDLDRFIPKDEEIILEDVDADLVSSKPVDSQSQSDKNTNDELSDELNGFEENINISEEKENENDNVTSNDHDAVGHLSDSESESGSESRSDLDTDENNTPPSKSIIKTELTSGKTELTSSKTKSITKDKVTDKVIVKSKSKSKSKAKAKAKSKNVPKYDVDDFKNKSVTYIKTLAKDNNISLTYDKSGKMTAKTKAMLINELSEIMS